MQRTPTWWPDDDHSPVVTAVTVPDAEAAYRRAHVAPRTARLLVPRRAHRSDRRHRRDARRGGLLVLAIAAQAHPDRGDAGAGSVGAGLSRVRGAGVGLTGRVGDPGRADDRRRGRMGPPPGRVPVRSRR